MRDKLRLYLDLIRWNRPAGWLLLLWPSLSALWIAAELEEEWQAEQWGRDAEAEERRTRRAKAFADAARFAALAQTATRND